MGSFASAGMRSAAACSSLGIGFKEASNDYSNYIIQNIYYENGYTILYIKYPDSENPNKILVFVGDCVVKLKNKNKIDPHFNKDDNLIARFSNTEDGVSALGRLLR